MELSGKQRRYLSRMAHNLKPVVYIGKNGLSENMIKAVLEALAHHELIKVKFVDMKEIKAGIMEELSTSTDSVLVQIIGNIGILYKANPDKKQYSLPA